ncbi:MAG TPA: serine/threonine-protein kinase [Drouetiella sp.]|jgi:Protein kinase domain
MDAPLKAILSNRYFFTKGVKASDDYEQFWIRYKPERVFRKQFGRYVKNYSALRFCAVALALAALYLFGPIKFAAVAAVIGVVFVLLNSLNLLAPTHIFLSENGLQLHWLRNYSNLAGPVIGWDRLTHLSIATNKNLLGNVESALEFNVLASGLPLQKRVIYAALAPAMTSGWWKGERCAIRLKLEGIASSDDRKRLQMALKKFLPSYRIDASVTDELNLAIRVESYTDLWLDALSSSKRIRQEMLEPGSHILGGRYEVVRRIGGGGQAVVYAAREKVSAGRGAVNETPVVLKEFVLPAQAGVNVRKRVLGNIQREAKILEKFACPNIVRFIDFFVDDQRAYLVLEHIEGVTLQHYIEDGGCLTEGDTIELALQMCEILKTLHSCVPPVIHRDFTPGNLMIDSNKKLKLIDFNVSEHLEASGTNSVAGKHAYIPPEQFRGKACGQSDIYAMGATLFYLLTTKEPEPISVSSPQSLNPLISDELDRIVRKATAQEVAERFNSWESIRDALLKISQERCAK